jgi:hypothetical protein
MAETLLRTGDELDVTVVTSKPFGVLVRAADGTAGLVRGARAEVGADIRVRIVEYDATENRFSAMTV